MKITILGASGFTGKAVVKQALDGGHIVYAVSRSGSFNNHDNLIVINEDVNNVETLAEKVKDTDLVVSCFNAGWTNPNLYDDFIKGSSSIIKLARKLKKRLIIVGGASSLYDQKTNEPLYLSLPNDFKNMVKGAYDLYQTIKDDKETLWTFISPAMELTENEPTYNYNIGADYLLYNSENKSTVSIYDLAHLILEVASKDNNIFKRLTLSDR